MVWPFQRQEKPLSQKDLLEEEKKQRLVSAGLDPRPSVDETEKAMRRDQYAMIMKWQQDRALVLRDIFCGFSGLQIVKDDSGQMKYATDPFNKPIASIWAAKKLTEFIRPQDHNAMLANWDEKGINSEMFSISTALIDYITLNAEDLEIDLNHFEYIVDTLTLAQHPTYQRGWNDGERRVMKETIKISEVSAGRQEKAQQKVFGIPISQN